MSDMTSQAKIIALPVPEKPEREAALERDIDSLVSVFRELHELEKATGNSGLSVRVRIAVMGILTSADKAAQEELSRAGKRHRD